MAELDPAICVRGRGGPLLVGSIAFSAHSGGYALDAQVGAVLDGLGFSKTDWARQTQEFSGGWQMRIALASCCWQSPTCCCSTNRPITWTWRRATGLKNYLRGYPNGYILISHDRYFLDVT